MRKSGERVIFGRHAISCRENSKRDDRPGVYKITDFGPTGNYRRDERGY